MVLSFSRCGDEVHGGEGLAGDLHVVGDDVLDGGGLVVGGWLVPGTLTVMLAMQTRLCGLLAGSARTGQPMASGGEYGDGTS